MTLRPHRSEVQTYARFFAITVHGSWFKLPNLKVINHAHSPNSWLHLKSDTNVGGNRQPI